MVLFKYSVRNEEGKFISSTQEAGDRNSLIDDLRKNKLFPISIEEVKPSKKRFPKRSTLIPFRLKDKGITIFTRQLSNLLGSGVMLPRALHLLVNHVKAPTIKEIIVKISDEVAKGGYFWEALSHYPEIFSRLYVSMVKAGEMGGNLEKVIESLADFTEQKKEMKDAFASMLIYPLMLALVGAGTIIFLMTFVIPKMLFIFKEIDQPLPLLTKILIAISLFLSKYWWLLLFLGSISFFIIKRLYSQENIRLKWEQFLCTFPLLGQTLQKILFVRFTRILGIVLSNGVSILDSLDIAQEVIHNTFIVKKLDEVRMQVSQGSSLSVSLTKAGIFSPIMVDMISVGEETGKVEEALLKLACTYEREVREEMKRCLSLFEPAIIFLLALGVGFVVMAVLLPIFQMNLQIL